MDFKLFTIVIICFMTKSVISVPCPSGEYGQCGQTQYRCPPNSVYSNGVCVMQQYGPIQEPLTNFIQAPSSCGSNTVLYNGKCQTSNVATCPYSSTLQNGICMRNQQYSMQPYQTFGQPQSMQYTQTLPQQTIYQSMLPSQSTQSWPYYQSVQPYYQSGQSAQPYYQSGQSIQSTQPYYQSGQPYYQSAQTAVPLPQPVQASQSDDTLQQTQSE